jgi:hypothetical protein
MRKKNTQEFESSMVQKINKFFAILVVVPSAIPGQILTY